MAYTYGNPRYGVSANFRDNAEDTGGSKTINYLNLKTGDEQNGYTATQVQAFIEMIATLTGKIVSNIRMTAERPLVETEEPTP